MSWLALLLRDRIVHFTLGAAAIFAVSPAAGDRKVVLGEAYLQAEHAREARRQGVARLGADAAAAVDRRAAQDELLYREALRLGLDRDDTVVREHLIQRMLVVAEDLDGASREPTRDEVRGYFERTRERWRLDERVHLVHVFAARQPSAARLRAEVLHLSPAVETPPALGDAFPRSRDVQGSRSDLAAAYGDAFADAVFALPAREWSAPLESRFGWHLVRVLAHVPGAPASLDEVFDRARLDFVLDRRREAVARYVRRAAAGYDVSLGGAPLDPSSSLGRVALRSEPSAED